MTPPRDPFLTQDRPTNPDGRHSFSWNGRSGGLVEGMRRFREDQTRKATPVMLPPSTRHQSVKRPGAKRPNTKRPPVPSAGQAPTRHAVEQMLGNLVSDDRYQAEGPAADRFRDTVSEAFRIAYPGPYEPGSWGRLPNGDRIPPSTTPEDLESLFRQRMGDTLPPYILNAAPIEEDESATPPEGTIDVQPQRPTLSIDPDGTDGRFTNHTEALEQGAMMDRNHLRQAAIARLEELDLTAEERAALEDEIDRQLPETEDGTQVALVPALAVGAAAGAEGLGTGVLTLLGMLGLLSLSGDTVREEYRGTTTTSPNQSDELQGRTLEGFPDQSGDIEQGWTETLPDESENPRFQGTLIFPDGNQDGSVQQGTTTVSPDQSGAFPDGTIYRIEDSQGNEFDVDVSDADDDYVDRLRDHLDSIHDDPTRDAVAALTAGGRLTTKGGDLDVSQITIGLPEGADAAQAADQAFDEIARAAGLDPATIQPNEDGVRRFPLPGSNTTVSSRGFSGEGSPTNEVVLRRPATTKRVATLKLRYGDGTDGS